VLHVENSPQQLLFTQRTQALSESVLAHTAPSLPPEATDVAVCDAALMTVLKLADAFAIALWATFKQARACASLTVALSLA
jgi:hypothetical protein